MCDLELNSSVSLLEPYDAALMLLMSFVRIWKWIEKKNQNERKYEIQSRN